MMDGRNLLLVWMVDLVHVINKLAVANNLICFWFKKKRKKNSLRPLRLLGPPPGRHGEPTGPAPSVTHTEDWAREQERGT